VTTKKVARKWRANKVAVVRGAHSGLRRHCPHPFQPASATGGNWRQNFSYRNWQ